MIKLCLVLISIYLLPFINSSSGQTEVEEEIITYDGICEMDSTPHEHAECFERTNHTHSCCYGEIVNEYEDSTLDSHSSEAFCFGVDSAFKFAPHFIQEIEIDHAIVKVHLTCKNENKRTCSRANPEMLEDCRMHGGSENSCCMITLLNKETDCILSKEKIDVEKNYSIFGNLIQCGSFGLQTKINFLFLFFLIIIFI
jgi:hypothetical protein